ncbi:MAG: hypothetical protein ACRCXY_00655 [Fusobacteriaceae bacterium]
MNTPINSNSININTEINKNTIIRILFHEHIQSIREIEILKIVSESGQTFRLSNGISIYKNCLIPYHYKEHFHTGEEYFFLEKVII